MKETKKIKNMRLSVIVPMYNAEKWIKRCIESILSQSFHDLELIIIDDGSTDSSLNIVKKYCRIDRRIRWISTKNRGSARAKNIGLKHMTGDIVTFVDADDFIESGMYETMISILEYSEADIVECACRRINVIGRELDRDELMNEEIEGNEQCTVHFMRQKNTKNYMCNKIYKRELIEGISFPPLYFSEDYYMNAILHSRSNKKVIVSQVFYNYMIYPGQTTDIRRIDLKKIDGIKAGNMLAEFFVYDKKLKNYACLYACNYALCIADNMYGLDRRTMKRFLKQMRPELLKSMLNISFDIIHDENEKKIIYQCFLMLIVNLYFYDFRWLFE